ncbi:MiaB/RimO family radical SAM methylthiotransferase [Acidipila sp. EB88]|uniref:MiaB/RimO family radical SAM methylthiotransferase n=1 Tax=Acidipila sp. EB88 TaxID=2305226 RepID=UPI000F5EC643|nr:radical SAM protein [Acidipila sp. EB88]RRA48429.1 radical SAM protein [Acidipila sp. EB88]
MGGYAIHNFGCRANAADGDAIATLLEQAGAAAASSRDTAGVVVINTCSVTAEGERNARALIRRVQRENAATRIVVTGCYAQRAPGELAALPGVFAVVGNSHKGEVATVALAALGRADADLTLERSGRKINPVDDRSHPLADAKPYIGPSVGITASTLPGLEVPGSDEREPDEVARGSNGFVPVERLLQPVHAPFVMRAVSAERAPGPELPLIVAQAGAFRSRPVLKVQDGCGNRCSFCVIPETRGPSRSVTLEEALAATRRFAEQGGQELVLSGINLGRWGRDLEKRRSLPELVRALLEETALPSLRISSVEPMDWGSELLALYARYGQSGGGSHARLAPHAHLPLQSGADTVLRRMHRRYRPWHYAEKVQQLRALLPDAAIGADVMVGFPGETDALFEESRAFIAAQPFTYLHLFPFSPRPNTEAETWHRAMPVESARVRQRMKALEDWAAAARQRFAGRFVGQVRTAVRLEGGTALTDNFIPVTLPGPAVAGQRIEVRIVSIKDGAMHGVQHVEAGRGELRVGQD